MADNLPINFNIPSEGAIASYSWTDVASGLGYVTLYLTSHEVDHVTAFSLIDATIAGKRYGSGWYSTTYQAFDSSGFNTPRTVKGKMYFSGQMCNTAVNAPIYAKVYHVTAAGVETEIGAENYTDSNLTAGYPFCLCWNIAETDFKIGEYIRIYVKTSNLHYISTDPSGTVPAGFYPSRVLIPFKLNL